MRSSILIGAAGAFAAGLFTLTGNVAAGPYAPAAGQPGSTAISNGSPLITGWATGHVNYLPGAGVTTPFNDPAKALGPAEGLPGEIVSLGDNGQITLTFANAIGDGPGFDFAIFENSFNDTFLEVAFVEVSDGGTSFVRFANDSDTANPVPFLGGSIDPTNLDGLAGKYRGGFGTPFDLATVGLSRATHVRLVDILGNGTVFDTFDDDGIPGPDPIYDPHPTTGSAGFDLDGVGVINHVPEPTGVAAIAMSAVALLIRRRRACGAN
jgi:hypothetical protein